MGNAPGAVPAFQEVKEGATGRHLYVDSGPEYLGSPVFLYCGGSGHSFELAWQKGTTIRIIAVESE